MNDFAMPNPAAARNFFSRHSRLFVIVLIILGVFFAIAYQMGRASVYRVYPQLVNIDEAKAILAKVQKLIDLPATETPSMITIIDAANVARTQPFLAAAEDGDILIVYPNAQEAFLYRPSTNKLIAVGPVSSLAQRAVPAPIDQAGTHATSTKK